MAEERNCINKKSFIKYLKIIGIDVRSNTKARGHSGFCLGNRIDIDKNLDDASSVRVLLHEFAHYIHYKLEPSLFTKGGSLAVLFDTNEIKNTENELISVALTVFDTKKLTKMEDIKKQFTCKIDALKRTIQIKYPDFKITERFREFEKYIKKSDARYLLKYDRVLIKRHFFSKEKILSVDSLDRDFPEMPKEFSSYIVLKSLIRKRNRVNARIYKIKKYLRKPTELFARFIEAYYFNYEMVRLKAPYTLEIFENLKAKNYYQYLNDEQFISLMNDCV